MHVCIRHEVHAGLWALKGIWSIAMGYNNKRFMTVFVKDVRDYSI